MRAELELLGDDGPREVRHVRRLGLAARHREDAEQRELEARELGLPLALPHHAALDQPEGQVAAAIAARQAPDPAGSKEHPPARLGKVLGDLAA